MRSLMTLEAPNVIKHDMRGTEVGGTRVILYRVRGTEVGGTSVILYRVRRNQCHFIQR